MGVLRTALALALIGGPVFAACEGADRSIAELVPIQSEPSCPTAALASYVKMNAGRVCLTPPSDRVDTAEEPRVRVRRAGTVSTGAAVFRQAPSLSGPEPETATLTIGAVLCQFRERAGLTAGEWALEFPDGRLMSGQFPVGALTVEDVRARPLGPLTLVLSLAETDAGEIVIDVAPNDGE